MGESASGPLSSASGEALPQGSTSSAPAPSSGAGAVYWTDEDGEAWVMFSLDDWPEHFGSARLGIP